MIDNKDWVVKAPIDPNIIDEKPKM